MGTCQCVDRVKSGGYQSSALWSRTKLCELQSVHSCEIIFRSGQSAAKGDLKGFGRGGGSRERECYRTKSKGTEEQRRKFFFEVESRNRRNQF
jgi:hypothetical protein